MLFFGQILSVASTKGAFLVFIAIFEIGSLLCGVAPNMPALIFGRAVAGVGAAGIFVASFTVCAQIAPLERRPMLFALAGVVFGLSSVIGPLLGGAFADKISWRWCFYINLPIGAVSVLFLAVFLPKRPTPENPDFPRPGWRKYIE
jgi:MFS family permease